MSTGEREPQTEHIDRSYSPRDFSVVKKTAKKMGVRYQELTRYQGQIHLRFFYPGDDSDFLTNTIDINIAKSHARSSRIRSLSNGAIGVYFETNAALELFAGNSIRGVMTQGIIGLGLLSFSFLDYREARREAKRAKRLLA